MRKRHRGGRKHALLKVLLIGNPNVGKSVIFGYLTGRYVTVSNYPGTTVEVSTGNTVINNIPAIVVDSPGINNLLPMSEDEQVTRDLLLNEKYDAVIQVADAKNLNRALTISLQLIEMNIPFILCLNMMDEAVSRGISINVEELSRILQVPVIPTTATTRQGLPLLKQSIMQMNVPIHPLEYDEHIEAFIRKTEPLIPSSGISKRSLSLMIMAGDESLKNWIHSRIPKSKIDKILSFRKELINGYEGSVGYSVNLEKSRHAEKIMSLVYSKDSLSISSSGLAGFLARVSMHRFYGLIFLIGVLYLVYQFVGVFGAGFLVDILETKLFGEILIPFTKKTASLFLGEGFFFDMLVGEFGLLTMALSYSLAIVLPIVGTFFIAFGILEDTGYLPRLAVMSNRIFKMMGLNGKAVLPMILGLGCDTMATLTSRIMESRKERLLVILLLALGVPCSAQLGVILAMLGSVSFSAILIWLLIVAGVLIITGYSAARILPGSPSDFILELPPFRIPKIYNLTVKTLGRIEWYLKEAVPLFIAGTFVLFLADKTGGILILRDMLAPVVQNWLSLPAESTDAFLIGFLRRDFGAAGLFQLQKNGMLNDSQVIVSMVTITLFIPCIANFFMIIKEQGVKVAFYIALFIFPFALLIGGLVNLVLKWSGYGE